MVVVEARELGERFADECAAADRLPRRVERTELRARGELDVAVVVRRADREVIVAARERAGEVRLQREAAAVLIGVRPVDGRAFEGLVGCDRLVILVEHDLFLVAFLLADEARRVLALLEIGVVAVQRCDVARAYVEIAAQRDRRRKPTVPR